MRFMLLQNYAATEVVSEPMSSWAPEDVKAHIEFQRSLNEELTERGELVDAQALAGPGSGQDRASRPSIGEQRHRQAGAAAEEHGAGDGFRSETLTDGVQ